MLQVLEAAGFHPRSIQLVKLAPHLFWSWKKPHRAVLRLLNRMRWHFNNYLHKSLFLLWDMHPRPKVFDCNLSVLAKKNSNALSQAERLDVAALCGPRGGSCHELSPRRFSGRFRLECKNRSALCR